MVAENHLTWRVSVLELAKMKTDIAKAIWAEYREAVDTTFINRFEAQSYDGDFILPRSQHHAGIPVEFATRLVSLSDFGTKLLRHYSPFFCYCR